MEKRDMELKKQEELRQQKELQEMREREELRKRQEEEEAALRQEEYNRGVNERIEAEWAEERRIEKKARDQEEARQKKELLVVPPQIHVEEVKEVQLIPCFKCDGKKLSKSGKPCKKCNGQGTLDSMFISEIMKIIQEEIAICTPITFNKLLNKQSKPNNTTEDAVHQGVACSKCGVA